MFLSTDASCGAPPVLQPVILLSLLRRICSYCQAITARKDAFHQWLTGPSGFCLARYGLFTTVQSGPNPFEMPWGLYSGCVVCGRLRLCHCAEIAHRGSASEIYCVCELR